MGKNNFQFFLYKARILRPVLCALFASTALACSISGEAEDYEVVSPPIPSLWEKSFGPCFWVLEWLDSGGVERSLTLKSLEGVTIKPFLEASVPVSAYPFWPRIGMQKGVFRPAGAIFPLDAEGGKIKLSWRGGVDANFYRLLASEGKENREAQNFDWKRFRALFEEDGKIEKGARENPWTVDWEQAAKKTAESSFNSSRIKSRKRDYIEIKIPSDGPWMDGSPFSSVFSSWKPGEKAAVPITGDSESFFCPSGVLRCGKYTSMFRPFN
ncbi:MAG: hypothetical protein LBC53_05120 [Spirochaetaceae bacterium]|jgi:hypothetical protein|nr:hypothetical protein [Spirochaetaceae bacterium]